ncbi:DNA-binding transcriptional regulator, LysR family [Actinacidiphila yanglinensis]|uniref:DNA-binding transcriptional regulator, LysR family n=1 Tax=Actinacidiphila yanglinensis TaxID=310779 RepID=A0A1H6E0G4_9ACTN|nr:LysR family transcriptional regulator [Actinacidiphila yanglinensis]SEG85284.1 DNA-binding transcriptional regulator, LysR family [Actinacidiphila yanglinensis]SEG91090.1 DNA-binding transcriptional regulator, LysR family [Actinacidiphila yanglinensis]
MPELTLTGLRVMLEVAQRGSFTAAAEALGYTQSAVSRQIIAMEAAVGTPLFERHARGVRPTLSGEALLRHARRMIAHAEAAELEIAGLRDRLAGRLTVGAYPTAAAVLVPRAIARLHKAHPALTVSLWEAGSPAQLRRVRAGRLEVAVLAIGEGLPDYDVSGLRVEVVRTGRGIGVAVPVAHPLASRDEVHIDDLAREAWIVGAGEESGGPQFGAWPTLEAPRVAYRTDSWQTRVGLVAAGLGVSVMPGLAADTVPRGVKWLRVDDPALVFSRETVMVTATEPSASASAMLQAVRDETAELATEHKSSA